MAKTVYHPAAEEANVCREGAIQLLHRAQSIIMANPAACTCIPPETICAGCTLAFQIDGELAMLEGRVGR